MNFEFDTQIKMLKHEVLKNVAILAKENKVTLEELEKIPYKIIKGDKANYRCCVYKERAIVSERAKLAAGFLANGDSENLELVDIKNDEQIIYVIEAACDRCPLNKYVVTEACRGCLAHKCKAACTSKAISYINGKAYINQEICKECGMCKKACPYDAISEVMRPCKISCPTGALDVNPIDRRAMIKEEECINCGRCMAACPFGAISDKSYIVQVSSMLAKNEEVYAVLAPAITGQFSKNVGYGKIKNAILKLGFTGVIEAALGADAVTINESEEFIKRMQNGEQYMTNSCCPAFVSFIQKKYKSEISNISTSVSPMVATGRYIKKNHKNAKVVFIGPCTAKKSEASKVQFKDAIDYVVTFEELLALFDAFDVWDRECIESNSNDGSIYGRGFGALGGLSNAILNYCNRKKKIVKFNGVKASGFELKKVLNLARVKKLPYNFIEGMMCDGGCINGPGTIGNPLRAKGQFTKLNLDDDIKNVVDNEKLEEFKDVDLEN